MAETNTTIINSIYLSATNDFQQRIPDPTQHDIAQTINALLAPENNNYLNQFVDALINRIGFSYVHHMRFDNPLKEFKGAKLTYGTTIQETALPWIKAHSYDNAAETLLKKYDQKAETVYHVQNRQDMYPITINRADLRRAFTSEYGLNDFVVAQMETPRNSDEYDEFQIMKELIAFYDKNLGFYKVNLTAAPNDETTGKEFLRKVKTIAGKLKFPSTIYNSVAITDIPVFVKKSELLLFVTPEVSAALDVETLALLFNIDKAEIPCRVVELDTFPVNSGVALLTTADFFRCHDTEYTISSFYNPERLDYNYYLHHWGDYSVSPFVPAVLFTTEAGTGIDTVTMTPTGITVTPSTATVNPGDILQLNFALTGTVSDPTSGVELKPKAVLTEVTGQTDKRLTRVDKYGKLHVSTKEKSSNIITVACTSTYINPSGETTELTTTGTYTVA